MSLTISTSMLTGYAPRTFENASAGDITIAVATDFNTAGEKLTRRAAGHKLVSIQHQATDFDAQIERLVCRLNLAYEQKGTPLVINGAGNGVYTLLSHCQAEADLFAYSILSSAMAHPGRKFEIGEVISGGQTGYDVAFIKAALAMGIPARINAARSIKGGILIRRADGKDVSLTEAAYRHEMGLTE